MIVHYNTEKKRVFFVFSNLSLGGVQTKMIHLANALVAQGVDCWIFLEERGKYSRSNLLDKRVKVIASLNIKVFNKRPFRGWRFMFLVSLFVVFLRPRSLFVSLAPLATHLMFFLLKLYPPLASRVVVNEDTFPGYEYEGARHASLRRQIMTYYPRSKRVIAVSQSTYNNLREQFGISSPPLTLLPNWTNFSSASSPSGKSRDIDLLYAGRLDAQKQPEVLVDVLAGIFKKRPQTTVRVHGDGEKLNEFTQCLKTLKIHTKVLVLPPTEDIEVVLMRSKILLFTSRYEGLPFVGVEAMKAGAVVACLDAPGLRDLVRDGRTGVMKRDVSVLVENIARLLDSPAALGRMQRAAFGYAKDVFSERNEERLIQMMLEEGTA